MANANFPELMPLVRQLWPICRSITGPGVRQTLDILGARIALERYSTPSGSEVFDWTVPPEWQIEDAYILAEDGQNIVDFTNNNLHVVQYSEPVQVELTLEELQSRLHSIPDQPDAIPYLTSYYRRTWGFCLSHRQRESLRRGRYRCVIKSQFKPDGQLDFAQCRVPGRSATEIFFSTYICHPSMANNELSGPVVLTALCHILAGVADLRLTYRAAFTTETIGTLCFLNRFGFDLRKHVVGGSVLTCVGDDGPFTYVLSRQGNATNDRLVAHVLKFANEGRDVAIADWSPIGSDERQYCSPGFDLPIGSFSRIRFGHFPEYHTSLDNLDFISEAGLQRSLRLLLRVCQAFEMNVFPVRTNPFGEPQLAKRGLYASDRTSVSSSTASILYILAYADGRHSMLDVAERAGCPIWSLLEPLDSLLRANLVWIESEAVPASVDPWQEIKAKR